MSQVFFDDSLIALVDAIASTLGQTSLEDGVILRDSTGYLVFVSASEPGTEDQQKLVEEQVRKALKKYAREDRSVLFANDPGAKRVLNDPDKLFIQVGSHFCRLVDRRIVGSTWLSEPASSATGPLRIVFASLKGGVGRTTALAVTAADFAARGLNVLVIDLDLEAPGVGELMLNSDRTPRFGVVDYLVENAIGGISDDLLKDFVGVSPLTTSGGGRIDVVPALGSRSIELPQNILPKLSRAMIEDINSNGEADSLGSQMSAMIQRLVNRESYDVVLIDSRAGLAELTAPAVLGLGATVLLFGTAQQQTITGYKALFAALKLLAVRDLEQYGTAEWRLLFRPVYAKASLDLEVGSLHAANLYDLFAENLYDREDRDATGNMDDVSLNFSADDPDAPHNPLVIPFDPRFVDFDPCRNQSQLARTFYEQTFRPFLTSLDDLVSAHKEVGGVPPGGLHE